MYKKLMLILVILPTFLFAQGVTTASFNGIVKDSKGEPLPGANIIAVHLPTGTQFGAASRSDGYFNIPNAKVGGPYNVTANFIGYKKARIENIFLALGENRRLDFTLFEEAIEAEEAVMVTAERNPLLSSSRIGTGTAVAREQIESLPTIQRSIQDFAKLTPQIVGTNIGQSENIGGSNIGGKNSRYNNIQVDGAILNDVFGLPESGTPGGQANAQPISLDAIEEFQVSVAPYDIRQGGFTGGLINAITKSGTNAFHGSVYSYGRNQSLVGPLKIVVTNPVSKIKREVNDKLTDFQEFQTGFRVGGPIIQNKLFFFLNGEIKRREDPLEAKFIGDSSSVIFFPAAKDSLQKIIDITKTKYGYDIKDALKQVIRDTDDNKIFARLDYNISDQHRLTLRHNFVTANLDRGVTRTSSTFSLPNQEYNFKNMQNSTVLQFNSILGKDMANEARVSYTAVRDKREIPSKAFPQARITVTSGADVFLGSERFSQKNSLDQDIFEFTDNFTYFFRDHSFTLGTHNEYFTFTNLFIQDFYGTYEFSNISNYNKGRPSRYFLSYSADEKKFGKEPKASWSGYQLGFYAQDEWKFMKNLNLTGGVRLDIPIFIDKPLKNDTLITYVDKNLKTNEVPSGQLLWSPRLGFNFDIFGNRNSQIRGGVGIFTGKTPGVWLSNQYSNTGVDFNRIDERTSANLPDFQPDPNKPPKPGDVGTKLSPVTTTEVNITDKNFKFPQVFRSNIAVDQQLPFGLIGTVEFIYTQNMNDILYEDRNLKRETTKLTPKTDSVAIDGRPIYSRTKVSNKFTNILVLKNSSEGYQYSLTTQIQKQLGQEPFKSMSGLVAYTFGQAKDINSGTSSRAISNWQNNMVKGDPNKPVLAISNFDIPHRIIANISYRLKYLGNFATTVSLIYEGRSGRPFSYNYNGDANGDGSSVNDLVYVPAKDDTMVLTVTSDQKKLGYTTATLRTVIHDIIDKDEGLKSARGKIMERNTSREPWVNQLDLRVTQEIPSIMGHYVELTFDILNVLNLINSDWGQQKFSAFPAERLFKFGGYDSKTRKPKVELAIDDTNGDKKITYDDVFDTDNLLSRWQIQVGLRYTF